MTQDYDFSRLGVLLVEDNLYVRRILAELLRGLGIGQVLTARNGVEAIERLGRNTEPGATVWPKVDLVISDLMMMPIDGFALLKWVRQSTESPNRFLPFIMMSGAADSETLQKAREFGVNEFLAKPFSAQSVSQCILEVIEWPRQFVATCTYFGPDRQRRSKGFDGPDKRQTEPDDATLVYSSHRVVRPKAPGQIYYFRLPNRLKEIVRGGAPGGGALPTKRLKEADAVLERKTADFHDWALEYLAAMSASCDEARRLPEQSRREPFEKINHLAHELRGQGGTFGYPLITDVGKMLFKITGIACPTDDDALHIIEAHINTMRVTFRDHVTGVGGEIGRNLLSTLAETIQRHSGQTLAGQQYAAPLERAANDF